MSGPPAAAPRVPAGGLERAADAPGVGGPARRPGGAALPARGAPGPPLVRRAVIVIAVPVQVSTAARAHSPRPPQTHVNGRDARSGCSCAEHLLCVRCFCARPRLRSPAAAAGAGGSQGGGQVPQVFGARPWGFPHRASSHRVPRPPRRVTRYVISSLELLVAEDYMIVYLNGATPRRRMPGIGWLKKCYQMIDRRWVGCILGLQTHPLSPRRRRHVAVSRFPSSGHGSSWTGDPPYSRTPSP